LYHRLGLRAVLSFQFLKKKTKIQNLSNFESLFILALMNELRRKTEQIIHEIQEQYLEDDSPWIIKFSGGKDSTATLQLIFYALSDLPAWKLSKSIHILANDTLVENPKVASFLEYQLQHIEIAGKKELFAHRPDLFHVVKTTPKPNGSFWFYLIGRGYPSPNRFFFFFF